MADGKATRRPDAFRANESPETAAGDPGDSGAPADKAPDRDGAAAGVLEERAFGAEVRHDDDDYDDDDSLRGIVIVKVRRKVLSTGKVDLTPDRLRRRKVRVVVDDELHEAIET